MFSATEEEREDAFRLRYKVYCEEMNLESPNANHEKKILRDQLDAFGHIINVYSGKNCVATVRLNILSEGDIGEFKQLYNIDSNSPPDQTAILTKLMVLQERRRSKTVYTLFKKTYLFGLERRLQYAYLDCIQKLVPFYEKWGFQICGNKFIHYETGEVFPMKLYLLDIDYFEKIKSPYAKFFYQWSREGL